MRWIASFCVGCAIAAWTVTPFSAALGAERYDRPPEDEIIYFVLPDRFENADPSNDRGGIEGDRLAHGFDPTNNGFYQGGDLKGLTSRLDYIQGLGATAIWLAPIFQNKAVQGPPGAESAGYHGYWITDFLNVDPHLGTREDFKALVDAAHARGMKVYMDIITNHTADVIKYRECHAPNAPAAFRESFKCPYRSLGDYPYTTIGDAGGEPINDGFRGTDPWHHTKKNFKRLTSSNYAYTPYVPEGEEGTKNPAWLNEIRYYHNRGDTSWEGENSVTGDFSGLDDLMTSNPRVVAGFIDIYKKWITDFRVDGFRIDTAKHVNPEFWQAFAPAIEEHARNEGIDHFHIFGEVYDFDPAQLAKFTTRDKLPTVLDFAFQGAVRDVVAEGKPARNLERLFDADAVYAEGLNTALRLPTFLGNHDMGRFSMFVRNAMEDETSDTTGMNKDELLERVILGHAMMMFSRGVPTIYYGDEQGFVSDSGDRGARESMFPGLTPDYLDNELIGSNRTVADENFDTSHPIYLAIAEMARLRMAEPALRKGKQIIRHSDREGGLIIFSRIQHEGDTEVLIAINADDKPITKSIPVDGRSIDWTPLAGACDETVKTPGAYELTIPARNYIVCKSEF